MTRRQYELILVSLERVNKIPNPNLQDQIKENNRRWTSTIGTLLCILTIIGAAIAAKVG